MHHPSLSRRPARAFTLLEAALVLFALALFGAIGVVAFGGSDVLVADRSAQANADVALDALVEHVAASGTPHADPELLEGLVPGEVTLLGAASTADGPGEVSVAAQHPPAGPPAVAAAARGADGACWYAYLGLEADPGTPQRRFSIATAPTSTACSGAAALDSAAVPAPDGLGDRWSKPVRLP